MLEALAYDPHSATHDVCACVYASCINILQAQAHCAPVRPPQPRHELALYVVQHLVLLLPCAHSTHNNSALLSDVPKLCETSHGHSNLLRLMVFTPYHTRFLS